MGEEIIDISDLKQDGLNFNKGKSKGRSLIKKSFEEFGAGRSVLIDKHGNIIAGNKSHQAAIAAGIKKVRIVETTGDELVAVKRTDIDIDSREGRAMALADNAASKASIEWDPENIERAEDMYEFDSSKWLPEEKPMEINMDDISDSLQHFYKVVVICKSEENMNELFNQLKLEGYKCNTLIL